MIVVVGVPSAGPGEHGPVAAGLASRIARVAAASGATVQFVGKVGDDPAGDAVLIDLARAGVGHAALLRDPAHPTRTVPGAAPSPSDDLAMAQPDGPLAAAALLDEAEVAGEAPGAPASVPGPVLEAADLELGLRYLVEFRVLVTTEPLDERGAAVVAEAAPYAGAQVVALVPSGGTTTPTPPGATVLEVPAEDPDGVFAELVAAFAVALDGGADAADAFRAATEHGGWAVAQP